MPLTPKQQRFVAEYLIDLNATQAAIRSGYSPKTARAIGCEHLTKPDIASAVAEGKRRQLESAELTAVGTLKVIGWHVNRDIRRLFSDQGSLIPLHELSKEDATMIAGVEVVKRNLTAGDDQTDTIIKVKLQDQRGYVELAAKHFGLLEEKIDVQVPVTIVFGTGTWQPPPRRLP
jgi:phage terminase small subunit